MILWIRGILVSLTLILLLTCCAELPPAPTSSSPSPAPTSSSPSPAPTSSAPAPTSPTVDRAYLQKHIQAFNFERYQSRDRRRARDYLHQQLIRFGWQPQTQSFSGGVKWVSVTGISI